MYFGLAFVDLVLAIPCMVGLLPPPPLHVPLTALVARTFKPRSRSYLLPDCPPSLALRKRRRSDHIVEMFYVKKLEHEIVLEPIHFGPKLKQTIIRLLKDEVEGLALATYGYVVNVIEVPEDEIRSGIIEYDTGNVVFFVSYTALLLRPFLNEVLDATVSQCNPLGFFAFVGPLRIFVSKHSMPEDMFNGFDNERDAWISDDKEVVITSGCGVRLKIKGRTVEMGNITAIGTIKDNYLGLIDDGSGELAEQ